MVTRGKEGECGPTGTAGGSRALGEMELFCLLAVVWPPESINVSRRVELHTKGKMSSYLYGENPRGREVGEGGTMKNCKEALNEF